jgi:hypothetical protein
MKGKSLRGPCGTTSADDGLRTGGAQLLGRGSQDPICLARAAIQPLILEQEAVEKRAISASLSCKSGAK